MDPRMYPQGNVMIDAANVVTTPTFTDKIPVMRGDSSEKAITIANLLANLNQVKFPASNYTAAGAIAVTDNYVSITNATPATAIALTIAAPTAGRLLIISQQDAGTAGNTVTLSTGSWDGSKKRLTFNAKDETVVAFGVSATRFVIIENIGSVAISTP